MDILEIIVAILSGLVIVIPLAAKIVKITRDNVKQGHWDDVVEVVCNLMIEAEKRMSDGATRKEWVLGMLRAGAASFEYDIHEDEWGKIDSLIDILCSMAKHVNVEGQYSFATSEVAE